MLRVPIRPADPQQFAPYGYLISGPQGRPPDIETEFNRYWDEVVPWVVKDGQTVLAYLEVYARALRFDTMECHRRASQAWVPLAGSEGIMAVALSDPAHPERPDTNTVRAIRFGGDTAVVLRPGTWHHLVYPVGQSARYLMILRANTKNDDMNIAPLPEPVELVECRLGLRDGQAEGTIPVREGT